MVFNLITKQANKEAISLIGTLSELALLSLKKKKETFIRSLTLWIRFKDNYNRLILNVSDIVELVLGLRYQ